MRLGKLWLHLTTSINSKMAGHKYDHRLMYKKYTTPPALYGIWGSRKTSRDGPANKKSILSKMLSAFLSIKQSAQNRTIKDASGSVWPDWVIF